jgi:hypothetical protein
MSPASAIWAGVTWQSVMTTVTPRPIADRRHRRWLSPLFSHRAYSTDRMFQFIIVVLATSRGQ